MLFRVCSILFSLPIHFYSFLIHFYSFLIHFLFISYWVLVNNHHNILVDAELAELHRKFRLLEGERKAFAEESQNTLRKQRISLEKLKKENEYLKEELAQVWISK